MQDGEGQSDHEVVVLAGLGVVMLAARLTDAYLVIPQLLGEVVRGHNPTVLPFP